MSTQTITEWRPIETAPMDGRALLLGYFNTYGKWRTLRGYWASQEEIDEHWEEPDGVEPGWFETSVESDDLPNCWRTEPTHWMPLPPAPGAESQPVMLNGLTAAETCATASVLGLSGAAQPANVARHPTPEDARKMGEKGGPVVEAERLAFEAWMAGHCWPLCATWNGREYRGDAEAGHYICPRAMNTRQLWAAWRDRAALAAKGASHE